MIREAGNKQNRPNKLNYLKRTKNSSLGKVAEVLSVTGYPDSTYEVRFEDGSIHKIIITQEEKNLIEKQSPVIHQSSSSERRKLEPITLSLSPDEDVNKVNRSQMINQILESMYPDGFDYVPVWDIMKQLEAKSTEELEKILNEFNNELEKVSSNKTL